MSVFAGSRNKPNRLSHLPESLAAQRTTSHRIDSKVVGCSTFQNKALSALISIMLFAYRPNIAFAL